MDRIALIIDAQFDFMDPTGALYVPGAELILPTLNDYISQITMENGYYGAIFTADTHNEKTYADSAEAELFPPHCLQGTPGHNFAVDMKSFPTVDSIRVEKVQELVDGGMKVDKATKMVEGLKIHKPNKRILTKGLFDMWAEDDSQVRPYKIEGESVAYGGEIPRNKFFDGLMNAGIDEVEVVGVASDYCVKDAVFGLLLRGFKVVVYDNLVCGIERTFEEVANDVNEQFLSYIYDEVDNPDGLLHLE